jgi:hypothetical protein
MDKLTTAVPVYKVTDPQTGATSWYMVPATSAKSTSAKSTQAVHAVATAPGKTSSAATGKPSDTIIAGTIIGTNRTVTVVSANGRWHVVNTKDTSSGGK